MKDRITQAQLHKARAEETAANQDLIDPGTKDINNAVKTDLDTSHPDLKMARSEMGTLIARNYDEIDQLRRLGERDYIEVSKD